MNKRNSWHDGSRRTINSLVVGIILIFMAPGIIWADKGDVKTSGSPAQNASFGGNFSEPKINALPDIARVPEINSMSAKDYNDRGITYSERGQYEQAILDFNKALEIDPLLAETYNNRGIAYSGKGRYDRAISDFNRALEINPLLAKTYYNLGITYAVEGEFERALSNFDKALEIDSGDATAYLARSSVFMRLTCMDWKQACTFGECGYIKEATRAGLCKE
ncbi:MAG TPA: tetratricopeptide repeat protein [Thermodesulfovibrionales bacterium]|nr:tetratricopeptide repeat protein [Thermodesulfovibrionales bacterium]